MANHMIKGIWYSCVLLLCTRIEEGSYIYLRRGHIKSFDEFRKWLIAFNMFLVKSDEESFILIVSSHVHLKFDVSFLIHPALRFRLLRHQLLQGQSPTPHLFRQRILLHLPPVLVITRVVITENPTIWTKDWSKTAISVFYSSLLFNCRKPGRILVKGGSKCNRLVLATVCMLF